MSNELHNGGIKLMATKYVMERRLEAGEDWDERGTVGRALMLARVARFVLFQRTRTRRRGNDYLDHWNPGARTLRQVTRRTFLEGEGYKVFIQRRRDRQQLSIHKVEVEPPVPNLGCAPELEKIHAALVRRYGSKNVPSGGRYFCRFVDGTHTVSKHGYKSDNWKGSAEDYFSRPDNMSALTDKAQFIVAETKAGRLKANNVIVGSAVWTASDGQWHPYHGVFHRHVHCDVEGGRPCNP